MWRWGRGGEGGNLYLVTHLQLLTKVKDPWRHVSLLFNSHASHWDMNPKKEGREMS